MANLSTSEDSGCWWNLANPQLLPDPIPCRANVGMWRMDEDSQSKVGDDIASRYNL